MEELSTVSSSSTEKSYVSRIDTGKTSSDIYKEVDVLRAILWIHQGCDEVSELKVTKCFENCGVVKFDVEDDVPFWFIVWHPRERTAWPNYIWRVCLIWQRFSPLWVCIRHEWGKL